VTYSATGAPTERSGAMASNATALEAIERIILEDNRQGVGFMVKYICGFRVFAFASQEEDFHEEGRSKPLCRVRRIKKERKWKFQGQSSLYTCRAGCNIEFLRGVNDTIFHRSQVILLL